MIDGSVVKFWNIRRHRCRMSPKDTMDKTKNQIYSTVTRNYLGKLEVCICDCCENSDGACISCRRYGLFEMERVEKGWLTSRIHVFRCMTLKRGWQIENEMQEAGFGPPFAPKGCSWCKSNLLSFLQMWKGLKSAILYEMGYLFHGRYTLKKEKGGKYFIFQRKIPWTPWQREGREITVVRRENPNHDEIEFLASASDTCSIGKVKDVRAQWRRKNE